MIKRISSRVRLVLSVFVIGVISFIYLLFTARNLNYWHDVTTTEFQPDDSCEDYLVCSPSCHIPDIDPWHESIRPFIKEYPPVVCSPLPPLTVVENDTLRFMPEVVHHYTSDDPSKVQCCYYEITRKETSEPSHTIDSDFSVTDCTLLEDDISLKPEQQFILVKCYDEYHSEDIYTNLHAIVPVTPSVEKKLKRNIKPNDRKMSVLMIGIDSISRLNFKRKMPKTVEFLNQTEWVEMVGYNKMADNTFPNLMAILSGMNPEDVKNTCLETTKTFVDDCPYIWRNFSDEGYITSYAEDESWIGTFNYAKNGFLKPPVDYYLRPFMCAAEKYTNLKKVDGNIIACVGPTLEADHVYRYARDFTQKFNDSRYFGLFWMNSLSHNDVNRASNMDEPSLKFLQDLKNNGILDNSFVVFFSDHGIRFGKIRETYVGWLEERLPFIYIWVPEWYRKLYPEKYKNLLANRNRLTSPYDLHLTLQEILYNTSTEGSKSCPKCLSLFDQIPHNRSCSDAGIIDHWCTCSRFRTLLVENSLAKSMAKFTIDEINNLLKNNKDKISNGYTCSELSLKNITSVRSKFDPIKKYDEYTINFITLPGEAKFEATISNENPFKLLGTVSRINLYGNQSLCVNEASLKLYCFCALK